MSEKNICIFCDSELVSGTKPEHILLNALGGRKTTRRAICSTCNNTFGGTIDDALTKQVNVIRNLLQFESGTGKLPPMLKGIQAGAERLNFGSDGRPEIVRPPFTVTDLGDGRTDVTINVRSAEEMKKMLPHLAAKLGMPEADLAKQISQVQLTVVEERAGQVHYPLMFGGAEALRSLAKSCLVLLASVTGTDALKAEPFAVVRDFVVKGGVEFSSARARIDLRDVPGLDEYKRRFGPFFNLITVRSNEAGRVIAHFTLYNVVGWQIVLAEQGGPINQEVVLVSNPMDPVVWGDEAAALPDIPFEWLNTADPAYEIERARERLIRMMEYHTDQSRKSEYDRIVDDVFDRHGINGEIQVSDPALTQLIFNEIAERIGAHAMRLRHERQLSPEEIEKLLRGG